MEVLDSDNAISLNGANGTVKFTQAGGVGCLLSVSENVVSFSGSTLNTRVSLHGIEDSELTHSAVTKNYVDGLVNGLQWKLSCVAATVEPGILAIDFQKGAEIDGVSLDTDDRILIKNQVNSIDNGIYIVRDTGNPVRSHDLSVGVNAKGAVTVIEEGVNNADTGFVCNSNNDVALIGGHPITFVTFTGEVLAGDGLTKSSNTIGMSDGGVTTIKLADGAVTRNKVGPLVMTLVDAQTVTAKKTHEANVDLQGNRLELSSWGLFGTTDKILTFDPPPTTIATWELVSDTLDWGSMAMSETGQYITCAGESIAVSNDTGQSWVEISSVGNTSDSAVSADGMIQVVCSGGASGAIFISTDSGITWTDTNAPVSHYEKICMSANGTVIFAVHDGLLEGGVNRSTDSGETWELVYNLPNVGNVGIAVSNDGQTVAAVSALYADTGISRSLDGGTTWVNMAAFTGHAKNVAISADGSIVTVTTTTAITVSNNFDTVATFLTPEGIPSPTIVYNASISSTGLIQVGITADGVFTSFDYGVTWALVSDVPSVPPEWYTFSAVSGDGSVIGCGKNQIMYLANTVVVDPLIDFMGTRIVNVANPMNETDVANKSYVDAGIGDVLRRLDELEAAVNVN